MKTLLSALVLMTVLSAQAQAQNQPFLSQKNVVVDSNGNKVVSLRGGTCVRTKWDIGMDKCGPQQRITSTSTVLHTELTDDERAVYFAFDSAALSPEARQKLDDVSQRLIKADDVERARIDGHADRIGLNEYNMQLSARRAEAVKNYLVDHGYLKVSVGDVQAHGESMPTTNCTTQEARSKQIACLSPDRRVEIHLTYVDRSLVTTTH